MRAEDTMHRQVLYIRRIIERGSLSSKEQVATGIGGTLRADLDQLPGPEGGNSEGIGEFLCVFAVLRGIELTRLGAAAESGVNCSLEGRHR